MSVIETLHGPLVLSNPLTKRCNAYPTKESVRLEVVYGPSVINNPAKQSLSEELPDPNMPVSTSSQSLLTSLPSFMSVFGNGPDRLERKVGDAVAAQTPNRTTNTYKRHSNIAHFSSPITRRDSTSTFASTESSPTTTISTVESSLTEPSPRSPPESPDSSSPLASFKNLKTNATMDRASMEHKEQFSSSFPTLPGLERADSPNKKMRNMKNLSVNTFASNRQGSQLPKLGPSNPPESSNGYAFSAPPTPAFIVPPKAPRKNPSALGLTITTPESSSSGLDRLSASLQSPVDPHVRTLRSLQASSSGSLFSPTMAPEGGMRLPPFSNQPSSSRPSTTGRLGRSRPPLSVSPLSSLDNTILSPVTRQTLDHVTEETDYDPPPSQEVKSPAYPQGPVCIYDPLVYLYLEPSHVEARQFDVVLNVAREVKNPFHAIRGNDRESQAPDAGVDGAPNTDSTRLAGRDSSYPQTAKPQDSSYSTSEAQSEDVNSTAAGTPKAPRPEPEYIHVPWDHNTNVVDDLLKLCELVDNRVRQEKRVLVHCQCGVSRSASLVVAYGLYKNPQLTVQEAYDAVKFRSRWIGPNMNLIYQLSEFKSKLLKSHPMGTSWLSWRSLGSGCSNPNALRSPSAMAGLPSSAHRSPPQISMSVPSPIGHEPSVKRSNSLNPRNSAELAPASTQGEIIPSPSSAPPYMQWSPGHAPMEPDNVALSSNCKVTRDAVSLPKSTDANASMTFPPSTTDREGIEEKVSAPVGGVADDLQEVAKCLINRDHGSVSMTPQKVMASDGDLALSTAALDVGTAEKTKAGSANDIEPAAHLDCGPYESAAICPLKSVGLSTLPASPMVQERMKSGPSIPTRSPALSAGFSSLLSRRHGPFGLRQLPIYPRLTTSRPLPRALDPDIPPTPSLLSPRAAEFTASPFHRTAAGDLAGSSLFEQGLMSPGVTKDDPRSPHQKGEAPITRSIFDMI